jgi:hypothetical protein
MPGNRVRKSDLKMVFDQPGQHHGRRIHIEGWIAVELLPLDADLRQTVVLRLPHLDDRLDLFNQIVPAVVVLDLGRQF